jgi:hypothetical protein
MLLIQFTDSIMTSLIKVFLILFFALPVSSTGTEKQKKYVVYNHKMKCQKISLAEHNIVILKGTISCKECVKKMGNYFGEKSIIVSAVFKSKFALMNELRELKNYGFKNEQIFFQFTDKNNMYAYRKSNKIFQNLPSNKFPLVMIYSKHSIQILDYPQFEEHFLME